MDETGVISHGMIFTYVLLILGHSRYQFESEIVLEVYPELELELEPKPEPDPGFDTAIDIGTDILILGLETQ